MNHFVTLCSTALIAIGANTPTQAQTLPTYTAWVAGTAHAPVSNHAGEPRDRALVVAGVERSYRLAGGTWGTLATSPALLPAVYTTRNMRPVTTSCGGVTLTACPVVGVPYATYGAGVLPLSLRFESPALGRVSLVLRGDAGGVYFARRVPAESGTRFNFAAQYGADLDVRATRRTWLAAGVRHLHLSNGGLGEANVGIDGPLLRVGLGWR